MEPVDSWTSSMNVWAFACVNGQSMSIPVDVRINFASGAAAT